jgi:hypothetical protein
VARAAIRPSTGLTAIRPISHRPAQAAFFRRLAPGSQAQMLGPAVAWPTWPMLPRLVNRADCLPTGPSQAPGPASHRARRIRGWRLGFATLTASSPKPRSAAAKGHRHRRRHRCEKPACSAPFLPPAAARRLVPSRADRIARRSGSGSAAGRRAVSLARARRCTCPPPCTSRPGARSRAGLRVPREAASLAILDRGRRPP